MTAQEYRAQLAGLLPPGPALPRDPHSALMRLLSVPAAELARVDARAVALLAEADPRATTELLAEWEQVAGLPDPCLGPAPTLAQRRARLWQQVTGSRGQSPAFFVGVALRLGAASASVSEYREHDCELDCEAPVAGADWRHAWRLGLPAQPVSDLTCEDGCEMPIRVWGDTVVECVVRALAPAHTIPIIAYG